jgi:outer membrane protein assembly factor BamD (BamD/ComL family)
LSVPESASSESARLAEARVRLRKDPSAAFAALESLRRDHPRGLLVQERELLTIEALHAMGNEQAASSRAQDFLTRYPKSPHTAAVRRVLEHRRTSSP